MNNYETLRILTVQFVIVLTVCSRLMAAPATIPNPTTTTNTNTGDDSEAPQQVLVQASYPLDGTLPAEMNLNFTIALTSTVVSFELQRNDNIPPDAPVVVGNEVGSISRTEAFQWESEAVAYYFDPAYKAHIRVTIVELDDGSFTQLCSGIFHIGTTQYSIEPASAELDQESRRRRRRRETREDAGDFERRRRRRRRQTSTSSSSAAHLVLLVSESAAITPSAQAITIPEAVNSGSGSQSSSSSQSSSATGGFSPYIVQLIVAIDYRMYSKWFSLSTAVSPKDKQTDTVNRLRYYFANIVNGVDTRYRSINSSYGYSVGVQLAAYYIAMSPNASQFVESNLVLSGIPQYLNAQPAIYAFTSWLLNNKASFPTFDQASLFTSEYMNDDGGNRIAGLSFYQSICTQWAAAIVQDIGQYGTSEATAHEMGHILGTGHDGIDNTCSAASGYIMVIGPLLITPAIINNIFRFSSCTQLAFGTYLSSLGNGAACIATSDQLLPSGVNAIPAGQAFTPDQQCQIIYGLGALYCSSISQNAEICGNLACFVPSFQYCFSSYTQLAFEGTSCGNNKWCVGGQCVYNETAPSFANACLFGDFKGPLSGFTNLFCSNISSSPWNCYVASVQDSCCQTCGNIYNAAATGCQYGDMDGKCQGTSLDCTNPATLATCCQTCNSPSAKRLPSTATITTTTTITTATTTTTTVPMARTSTTTVAHTTLTSTTTASTAATSTSSTTSTTAKAIAAGDSPLEMPAAVTATMWTQQQSTTATPRTIVEELPCVDTGEHCGSMEAASCYGENNFNMCCETCTSFAINYNGPPGCQYGDHYETCVPEDCSTESLEAEMCCATCASLTSSSTTSSTSRSTSATTTLTTSTSTTATTSTTTKTTTTSTQTTTTQSTTTTVPTSTCQGNVATTQCQNLAPTKCYQTWYQTNCCAACLALVNGPPNCPYGDQLLICSFLGSIYCPSATPGQCCKTCGR